MRAILWTAAVLLEIASFPSCPLRVKVNQMMFVLNTSLYIVMNIAPSELRKLSAGAYLVPDFQFQCRGCVEKISVQALIPGYVYDDDNPDPINITMNFMIWTPLVDDQSEEDSLYSLRYNVTKMMSIEVDISPTPA